MKQFAGWRIELLMQSKSMLSKIELTNLEWLIESAEAGIGEWSVNGHTVTELRWHPSLLHLYWLDEFDGSYDRFIELIYPDDRDGVHQAVTHAVLERSNFELQYRIEHVDNSVRWFQSKGQFQGCRGAMSYFVEVVRDITCIKQLPANAVKQERKWLRLLQNSSDVAMIVSVEGVVLSATTSAERVLGFASPKLIGKNWISLIHPNDRFQVCKAFKQIMALPNQTKTLSYRCLNAANRWFAVKSTLQSAPDLGGLILNTHEDVQTNLDALEARSTLV